MESIQQASMDKFGFSSEYKEFEVVPGDESDGFEAIEMEAKEKCQANIVGNFIGINHAFVVFKFINPKNSKEQYIMCDFDNNLGKIVFISKKCAQNVGKSIQKVDVKKNFKISDLRKLVESVEQNYNLFSNNCSDFAIYIQENVQFPRDQSIKMKTFTKDNVTEGAKNLTIIGLVGAGIYTGCKAVYNYFQTEQNDKADCKKEDGKIIKGAQQF